MKSEDVEKIVVELGKEGKTPAQIGLILRDIHGIPKAKLVGKKIQKILNDAKVERVSDKELVNKKIEDIKKHIEKNKHDYTATRSLTKKLWEKYHLERKK